MATCFCVDHSISCCTHCPSFSQVPPAVVAPHRPRTRCKRARQAWLRTFWVPFSCPPRRPPPEDFGVVRVRREADPAPGRSLLQRQNTGRLGRRDSGVLLWFGTFTRVHNMHLIHPLNLTKSIQLLQQIPHVVSHCHSLSRAESPGVRSMLLVLS
jgi:hypothetical protein